MKDSKFEPTITSDEEENKLKNELQLLIKERSKIMD